MAKHKQQTFKLLVQAKNSLIYLGLDLMFLTDFPTTIISLTKLKVVAIILLFSQFVQNYTKQNTDNSFSISSHTKQVIAAINIFT